MTALSGWENFYVIVASSAGALIGLQFVVITLIADRPIAPGQAQAGDAFATPTIVHFGIVLLLSAALNPPWHGIGGPAILWALLGLGGVAYAIIVTRRMRVQIVYCVAFPPTGLLARNFRLAVIRTQIHWARSDVFG